MISHIFQPDNDKSKNLQNNDQIMRKNETNEFSIFYLIKLIINIF